MSAWRNGRTEWLRNISISMYLAAFYEPYICSSQWLIDCYTGVPR